MQTVMRHFLSSRAYLQVASCANMGQQSDLWAWPSQQQSASEKA